ncbi:MAG: dihydrodipicolinate synthase family protein [Betaproteobacteria bacterium]|nr:dihydrodipicolinate synthase family protein [Betaproteobacteria bacterium]
MQLILPDENGALQPYKLTQASSPFARVAQAQWNRSAYAAAHVVVDPLQPCDPWDGPPVIDWQATLRFREHLWRLGFKVAEAMDTAQRGMGLDWPGARELIRRSVAHARTIPGADLACGVGTDQLVANERTTIADVMHAYQEQIEAVEAAGGRIILMASRALAAVAKSADDYKRVYGELLRQCKDKVVLHWLGEMFDPALKGYWGTNDIAAAMDTVLDIVRANAQKIEGIKISLLDAQWEVAMRPRLPDGVIMFTGDDFNYDTLIAGDGSHHSHALLGIFDPIAQVAAAALARLASRDAEGYKSIIAPTIPLSREIFRAPTRHYKAGVIFIAWLNGHQSHFVAAGGLQSARSVRHYAKVFELADRCGALIDPELAVSRMRSFLRVHAGIS